MRWQPRRKSRGWWRWWWRRQWRWWWWPRGSTQPLRQDRGSLRGCPAPCRQRARRAGLRSDAGPPRGGRGPAGLPAAALRTQQWSRVATL
jgi:hypothetical protein